VAGQLAAVVDGFVGVGADDPRAVGVGAERVGVLAAVGEGVGAAVLAPVVGAADPPGVPDPDGISPQPAITIIRPASIAMVGPRMDRPYAAPPDGERLLGESW
jgi:hypothetical protein